MRPDSSHSTGYEVARGLAEAGSDIALWYYKATDADKLAATLERDFGVRAKAYHCDVAEYAQVQSNVDAVVHDFGHLDVMIANAGIPSKKGGLDDRLEVSALRERRKAARCLARSSNARY